MINLNKIVILVIPHGSVCQYNEDCPPELLCDRLNRICISPCAVDQCGDNAECIPSNHGIQCKCYAGFTGNPFLECFQGNLSSLYLLHTFIDVNYNWIIVLLDKQTMSFKCQLKTLRALNFKKYLLWKLGNSFMTIIFPFLKSAEVVSHPVASWHVIIIIAFVHCGYLFLPVFFNWCKLIKCFCAAIKSTKRSMYSPTIIVV